MGGLVIVVDVGPAVADEGFIITRIGQRSIRIHVVAGISRFGQDELDRPENFGLVTGIPVVHTRWNEIGFAVKSRWITSTTASI